MGIVSAYPYVCQSLISGIESNGEIFGTMKLAFLCQLKSSPVAYAYLLPAVTAGAQKKRGFKQACGGVAAALDGRLRRMPTAVLTGLWRAAPPGTGYAPAAPAIAPVPVRNPLAPAAPAVVLSTEVLIASHARCILV